MCFLHIVWKRMNMEMRTVQRYVYFQFRHELALSYSMSKYLGFLYRALLAKRATSVNKYWVLPKENSVRLQNCQWMIQVYWKESRRLCVGRTWTNPSEISTWWAWFFAIRMLCSLRKTEQLSMHFQYLAQIFSTIFSWNWVFLLKLAQKIRSLSI